MKEDELVWDNEEPVERPKLKKKIIKQVEPQDLQKQITTTRPRCSEINKKGIQCQNPVIINGKCAKHIEGRLI